MQETATQKLPTLPEGMEYGKTYYSTIFPGDTFEIVSAEVNDWGNTMVIGISTTRGIKEQVYQEASEMAEVRMEYLQTEPTYYPPAPKKKATKKPKSKATKYWTAKLNQEDVY